MNRPEFTPSLSAVEEAAIGQRAHAALEAASAELPPDIVFRLAQSRDRALALHGARPAPVALLQLAGMPGLGNVNWLRDVITPVLGIAMLALMATAAGRYTEAQSHSEAVDTESALLTDDLPIDAYLDRGFGAWVDRQAGAH